MLPRTWPRFFSGCRLTHTTELFVDAETADGGGVSDALGLAGYINVDVVRNPELGPTPYLARAMVRQIIPLSKERVDAERGPFALATSFAGPPPGIARGQIRHGRFLRSEWHAAATVITNL